MAIRVYRIAVVGCPRAVVEPVHDGTFTGVGKSCFCNRFVKPSAYTETHNSIVSNKKWLDDAEISGDHFIYWGATTRHLQDGSKARFQVVEQTEFYEIAESGEDLQSHPSESTYVDRASSVRFSTSSYGKVAVRLKAEQSSARVGGLRSTTQIFPNEDFAGKNGGVMGYACIFDPTLTEEQMKRQMVYLTDLLQALSRRKKKIALVCTKCDEGEESKIKLGASLAACGLRKPIPFFEVSSRDDINIEDVFYSLIGHAKKSPKIPRTPKSPRSSGRHFSVSANVSYKDALKLRKNDIHKTKDAFRRLLQKKIVTFSTTWSEACLMLEKDDEFSDLLKLAGKDGNETVKNMFCLRLIEIKLTEAAKLYGLSSATKKLNKEKLQEYQRYISDALKNHPDLRNESVYDYVYSPSSVGDDPSHSHQTSFSSDNTSGARSNCNTPDHQSGASGDSPDASCQQLGGHSHSVTMPDLSERSEPVTTTARHSVELLSTYSPHRAPLSSNTQNGISDVHTYSSNPNVLDSGSVDESDTNQLSASHSYPILDVTPPPLPLSQRLGLDRRRSNSMGSVSKSPRLSRDPSSESVDVLNAEPYLQPLEVQMVMHTLPRTQKLAGSTSFHSIHEETQHMSSSHRQLPIQTSAIEISRTLSPSTHDFTHKLGHRRTASNPWVLEGNRELPPLTPKLPPPLPPSLPPVVPPIPARDHHRTSTSPPLLTSTVLDPHESSLDFSRENRRSVVSTCLSPKPQAQPQYADIDDVDRLSTISGPFEEISDDPDSSAEMTNNKTPQKSDKPGTNSAANSQSRLVKKKSSTLNSDYEKIEEYITMAPTGTFPRRSILNSDTPNKPNNTTPKKTTVVPSPVKTKKQKSGWSRQSTDAVIPDAATIRSSSPPLFPTNRRFTMLDNSQRNSTASTIRPLPPSPSKSVGSPTKAVRGSVSRNSSDGSNIYETIDEELLSRVYSRRRGSGLPKWAPPVAPKHYAQYLVVLRKFFTDPHIIEAWEKTVQEIIPGGDVATYPPPYSNLAKNQPKRLGPTIEVPMPKAGSAEPETSTKTTYKVNHTRHDSHDQYVLPMLAPQKTKPQGSSSTPATPAPTRNGMAQGAAAFSSPRARYAASRPNSRDNLIEMLNMSSFNQADSSDSGSSDSEESDDDESDEREEEEEGESEDGEETVEGMVIQGGSGMLEGGDDGVREGSGREGETMETVKSIKNDSKDETDNVIAIKDAADDGRQSPPPLQSPSQNLEDELDSILTNLNPILNVFGSIIADDNIPLDLSTDPPPNTTSETRTCDPIPTNTSPRESDSSTSAPVSTHSPQRQNDSALRASVSTDSDLDSGSLVKPSSLFSKNKASSPAGGSRVRRWVNSVEEKKTEEHADIQKQTKRTAPPIPKKKPTRRRDPAAVDGLSDSGISNCHSQTFDDGFNPLENN